MLIHRLSIGLTIFETIIYPLHLCIDLASNINIFGSIYTYDFLAFSPMFTVFLQCFNFNLVVLILRIYRPLKCPASSACPIQKFFRQQFNNEIVTFYYSFFVCLQDITGGQMYADLVMLLDTTDNNSLVPKNKSNTIAIWSQTQLTALLPHDKK